MTKQEKVFDIINKFEFFQGQRAGRELWNDKPKEVQDKDIADFIKDINYIRSYLQDSVVLSREEICELKCQAEEDFNKAYDLGSKETAEKIITFLNDYCDYDSAYLVEQAKEYVAKKFGVEIKE